MECINDGYLILEKEIFKRDYIEKRMLEGGFNSIARFELFIWDLEMLLQLQKKLGNKIVLKGGAAAQFYVPVAFQRTSIDIDMVCMASRREAHEAIAEIEKELNGDEEYCKFKAYNPKNPKLGLDAPETYYMKVPSICNDNELYTSRGEQEVKIEILYSDHQYHFSRIQQPELFALETQREFYIMTLESLFADKLTTICPNTIGIPDERADEQFKQIYDVITLFIANAEYLIKNKEKIREHYRMAAGIECYIHNIPYQSEQLFEDMMSFINRVKNIESDSSMLQLANDFQSLYLRRTVNRDKAQWAIVGFQLELLIKYIFHDDGRILKYREIVELIDKLKFENIHGLERGRLNKEARSTLESKFNSLERLSVDIFRKRLDRIIWELVTVVSFEEIETVIIA